MATFAFCAMVMVLFCFFFQAEDGIRDDLVTGVQTCALPIFLRAGRQSSTRVAALSGRRGRAPQLFSRVRRARLARCPARGPHSPASAALQPDVGALDKTRRRIRRASIALEEQRCCRRESIRYIPFPRCQPSLVSATK